MKVEVKDKSTVEKTLAIEVEPERYQKVLDKVLNKVAREVAIPGFRKGKAPKNAVMRRFGMDALKIDLLEELIPQVAVEAIQEQKLNPLSTPRCTDYEKIIVEEGKPINFEITFEVKPEFDIKDYKGLELIRIVRETNIDELVEKQISSMQEQAGSMVVVEEDRPVVEGDVAHVNFISTNQDGVPIKGGSAEDYYMTLEKENFIPGFMEKIIGHKVGEEWEFDVNFPEDYPNSEMAGNDIHFCVKLLGIKKKELPERDDEFAKSVGSFETYEQMKNDIESRIKESIEMQQRNELEEQAIAKLVDQMKNVEIPTSMVEGHLGRYVDDFRNQIKGMGKSLEEWLKEAGSNIDDFRKSFYPQARNAAKAELIIDKIAEKENVEATDEDVDKEIEKFAGRMNQSPEMIKQIMTRNNYLPVMRYELRNRKVFDLVLENANISEQTPEQVKAQITGRAEKVLAEAQEEAEKNKSTAGSAEEKVNKEEVKKEDSSEDSPEEKSSKEESPKMEAASKDKA
jgi:trigger factor